MQIHHLKFLFISVFAVIQLAGCNIANSLRMMQINSDVEPVFTGDKRLALDAQYQGEKPYIHASVNGEKLLFLVDTGARFLILMDTPKVKQLGLKRGFDLSMGGWGEDGKSAAYQTDIQRIDLGGVHFDNMKAALIPVSESYYYLREDEAVFDGVIGHDMMRHFTWEFDASANEIILSTEKYQPQDDAHYLELSTFMNKIRVKGDLAFNEKHVVEGEFIVDTGSRHYVKLSALYVQENEIEIASPRVRAADFGLSGKVEHDRASLPWLSFGDLKIDNVKVNLIPGDDEDDWWVIGNALMNQFKTVIDYPNDAFYLVPQMPFVTDYNLLGLELRKIRSGDFVVRYVFPNLPASRTSIKEGDIVTLLNQQPASAISLSQYNDIASQAGEHQVCIASHNQCFVLNAVDIKGYSTH